MRSRLLIVILALASVAELAEVAEARAPQTKKRHAPAARSIAPNGDARPHRAVMEPGAPDDGHNTVAAADGSARALAERLDGILGSTWLKSAVNGVYVIDTLTGQELYAYGADRQLNPASNTKLVSTAT